jgi:hypothetical protein
VRTRTPVPRVQHDAEEEEEGEDGAEGHNLVQTTIMSRQTQEAVEEEAFKQAGDGVVAIRTEAIEMKEYREKEKRP